MKQDESSQDSADQAPQRPAFVIVWDPEIIDARDYANLVDALGDLARAHDAAGLVRLRSPGFEVPIPIGVPT